MRPQRPTQFRERPGFYSVVSWIPRRRSADQDSCRATAGSCELPDQVYRRPCGARVRLSAEHGRSAASQARALATPQGGVRGIKTGSFRRQGPGVLRHGSQARSDLGVCADRLQGGGAHPGFANGLPRIPAQHQQDNDRGHPSHWMRPGSEWVDGAMHNESALWLVRSYRITDPGQIGRSAAASG